MQYYMRSALNILLYYVCGFFIQKSSQTHIYVYATLIDESEKNVYHFLTFLFKLCACTYSLVILNNKSSKENSLFKSNLLNQLLSNNTTPSLSTHFRIFEQ